MVNLSADVILGGVLAIVFALLGVLIIFKVGAAILPTTLTAVADLVNSFKTGTVNDTTGNVILNTAAPILIGVLIALGLVFMFIAAASLGFERVGKRG